MTSTIQFLLMATIFGAVMATWSMSNYACNQPQLYQQCNCQTFCSSYVPSYTYSNPCYQSYGGCGGRSRGGRRRHHKKPRRKFRIDSDSVEVPSPPPPRKSKIQNEYSGEEEGFIEEKPRRTTTVSPDSSWENEDLWEKKFENRRPTSSRNNGEDEEFPDIDSAEFETTYRPVAATAAPVSSGGGLGGLGLGNGGLFGISSGVGVGVPGVGPIGVSSGLGIDFYGSMSQYACNQPQLYNSCNCQNFCQPYTMQYSNCNSCQNYEEYEDEDEPRPKKKKKNKTMKKPKNKKKKTFKFSSEEEVEEKKKTNKEDEDEFPLPPDDENGKKSEEWEDKFEPKKSSGSSGLAGLGLGNGGLFGISSGVGVGVPGVGPIGVGSGIGVGR